MKLLCEHIVVEAKALGFDKIGFASAESDTKATSRLDQFLTNNYHGSMAWMSETAQRRSNPQKLWPEARSIIMLAMNYGPENDPLADRGSIVVACPISQKRNFRKHIDCWVRDNAPSKL